MGGEGQGFVFGCCPRGWETQCGASSCAMIAGCVCRTYIQRQACRHRKSGAAHRTPFFCKSLSCTKHHAACQASCASFTQTSRMRWECGRVAAASVSALSLFPAACSTAVLCYHPPRAFFFSIPLFRQPHRRASCRAAAAAAACCLLLRSHTCTHTLSLSLSHTLSHSPHLSCVCLLAGGFYTPLLLSATATTNTATTFTSPPITHPPPPSLTHPPPQRNRHRPTNFRRVASLSLFPPSSAIEGVRPGLLFRPNREVERDRR